MPFLVLDLDRNIDILESILKEKKEFVI